MADEGGPGLAYKPLMDIDSGHRSPPKHAIGRKKRDMHNLKTEDSPGPGAYENKRHRSMGMSFPHNK